MNNHYKKVLYINERILSDSTTETSTMESTISGVANEFDPDAEETTEREKGTESAITVFGTSEASMSTETGSTEEETSVSTESGGTVETDITTEFESSESSTVGGTRESSFTTETEQSTVASVETTESGGTTESEVGGATVTTESEVSGATDTTTDSGTSTVSEVTTESGITGVSGLTTESEGTSDEVAPTDETAVSGLTTSSEIEETEPTEKTHSKFYLDLVKKLIGIVCCRNGIIHFSFRVLDDRQFRGDDA